MTKEDIILKLGSVAHDIKEGVLDPIDGYIFLYEIEKTAKELKTVVMDDVLERASALDCDHIQQGYKVRTKSKTTYNYKGSQKWHQLTEDKKKLEAQMRFATAHGEMADTESGDIIEPAEVKTSTFIELTYKGDN